MCLFTDNPKPKVAKKSIRVWKRLIKTNNGFKTPYQDIEVKPGDSLKGLNPNAVVQEDVFSSEYIVDIQSVHAYNDNVTAKIERQFGEVITEWRIPVGAKYWLGYSSYGEVAATEMKFIKVCDYGSKRSTI